METKINLKIKNIFQFELSLIIALLFSFLHGAGVIRGQIIDGISQLPLTQANIVIENSEIGTSSDDNGEFVLKCPEEGYYSISISFIGYKSKILYDIWVRPNAYDYQKILLYPSVILLDNIVVTESYFEKSSLNSYSVVGFKNDQIRRAPGAGGEITRILNSLPSVASVGENRQDIMVRGGGPNENGFLIDNVYIPSISHFNQPDGRSNGPVGLINTELVETMDFYSNGFSPQYGNKLSSFGDISYREGNKESIEGNIGLGLGGAGGVLEGPITKRSSFLSSFRMSYLDIISDAINAGGLPSYSDYQGKINYRPNPYSNFTILGILGSSLYERNVKDARSNGEDSYGYVKNDQSTLGLNHRFIWSKNGFSNSSVSLTNQTSKNDFFNIYTDSTLNAVNDLYKTFHFRNINQIRIKDKVNTVTGFEYHHRDLSYDFTLDNLYLKDDLIFTNIAAFSNISFPFKSISNFSLGIRLEKSDFEEKINFSPRVNIDFDLPLQFGKIIFNGGRYFQNPPEKYLGLVEDDNLESVRAEQYSFSYEKLLNESTKLSVSIYNKKYSHAPIVLSDDSTASPAFLMDRSITFNQLISEGNAEARGIEFLIEKKRAENFYGHFGGSLFNSIYVDYQGIERNRDSNYKYILNLVGGYRPNNKWELSLRWSLFGGKPYTEIDREKSLLFDQAIYLTEKYNEKKTPVYHNLFLRYEYRKVYKFCNVISYIELWNAYNRKNIETYIWSNSKRKLTEVTYFSFIPVGGFEIEF